MDYYAVAGMVVFIFIAFATFYYAMKKNISEQISAQNDERNKAMEATNQLTKEIMELNLNFKHMREQDEIRDKRINSHSEDIDEIIERQRRNEKVLDLHNYRIGNLENAIGRPYVYERTKKEDDK